MKNLKLLLGMFIFAITFTSCTFDDDVIDPSIAAYENADDVKGGMMYDKFWRADAEFDQSNPNIAALNAKADFFRCKQCHGWDGLGNKGAYINRAPNTNRPNVTGFNLYELGQTETAQQIFDDLNKTEGRRNINTDLSTYDPATNYTEGDKMPNLTQVLTEAQMWDLVKFIKEGMFDVTELYDATTTGTYPTGTWTPSNVGTNGNAAAGKTIFANKCASCHGATGVAIVIEKGTVGAFVRTKGNEAQHKVKYGIEDHMPLNKLSISEMKDLYKGLADEVAFPNPL